MKKEMLINVLQPEECRIAILEDRVLEELYVERTSHESYVGNIYKGRIVNIEPSIQAAFVDFGVGRNGFLHVSDVEPAYYRHLEGGRGDGGRRGERGDRRDRDRTGGPRPAETRERAPVEFAEEPETTAGGESPPSERRERKPARGRSRRGRRGGRGRSKGEQAASSEAVPVEPLPEEFAPGAADAGVQHEQAGEQADEERGPERQRYMDSAERRTEEDDSSSDKEVSDDDIFFPRSESGEPGTSEEPAPAAAREDDDFGSSSVAVDDEQQQQFEERQQLEQDSRESDEPPSHREEREEYPQEGEGYSRERGGRRRGGFRDDRRGGRPRRPMGGRPGFGRPKPLIQDIFRRGQEVLVQVIKEGIGTKGPTLSTYISIAGRYLVLMPGLNRIGVSRKIADEEQRRRLREVLNELQPPKGLGFIIRTAGLDKNKKELQRDLAYLSRLWQVVVRRIRKIKAPAEIYQESDMITRTIRDTFTNEIDTILVDEPAAFEHAQEFLQIVMPRYANRIKLYQDSEPMFHKYGIEDEIARIQQRHVPLPNGGSIVIEQTEALVAIDVNSGNFRADNNAEETAYQMNLLAAREIARQLRLRDLGGVIVNDFIDMRDEKHRRGVERALRDAAKRDRARTKILKISAFGLIEMTRQRIRPSLKRSVYQDCPHCLGTGQVKTCESMSIDVMRMLQLAAHRANVARIVIEVSEEVANYLLNKKRKEISELEQGGGIQVVISGVSGASPEMLEFACYDNNNTEVKTLSAEEGKPRRRS